MAFLSRLRHSKLKFHLIQRCYTPNHSTILANQHVHSRTLNPVLDNLDFVMHGSQLELIQVRFYAAPAHAVQKKEERDTSGPRLNEQITAPSIRLVSDQGHCVVSRYEALARARSLKMDLVEVDRNATPPVCKIQDYHKEKYIQQTKEKERAKSKCTPKKGGAKEVRFAAKIKQNDLKIKADMVKRLMENGYRVKCTAIDPTSDCDLETLLSRFSALIEDVAIVESAPKVEKKQAFVVVRHVKFGPAKNGSGKKSSKSNNQELENNGSDDSEEPLDKDDVGTKKSEWAVFDGDEDINAVFDINEENVQPKSPILESAPSSRAPTQVNRYARDPTAGKPSRIPTDINGNGAMNRIPNQPKQPQFSMNSSPQSRPNRPFEGLKQNSSGPNIPNSPPKNFGIFSTKPVNTPPPVDQNVPAETNRYKKSSPNDSARNSRTGVPPVRNSTATDSRMNQGPGPGFGNRGERRW